MAHSSKYGYPYTSLSDDHKCRKCGKGIKRRLVKNKTTVPTLCYKCYKDSKNAVFNALRSANNIIKNNPIAIACIAKIITLIYRVLQFLHLSPRTKLPSKRKPKLKQIYQSRFIPLWPKLICQWLNRS